MTQIIVPKANDNMISIVIDGVAYELALSYNAEAEYWSLGVYDSSGTPIIARMKIVPNFPINRYFWRADMPQGIFVVATTESTLKRDSFDSEKAELLYIPYEELPEEVRAYAR